MKNYAKNVVFKAHFAVLWAQRKILGSTTPIRTNHTVIKSVCLSMLV